MSVESLKKEVEKLKLSLRGEIDYICSSGEFEDSQKYDVEVGKSLECIDSFLQDDVLPLVEQIADLKENYRVTLENLFSANSKKIEMQKVIHIIHSDYEACYQAKQELEGRLSAIQKHEANSPTIKVIPIPIDEKCTFKCGQSTYEEYIRNDIDWHQKNKGLVGEEQ